MREGPKIGEGLPEAFPKMQDLPLIFSGLLVGFRICFAMAIGMSISWFILPSYLLAHGMITEQTFPLTLRWVMWPATGFGAAITQEIPPGVFLRSA